MMRRLNRPVQLKRATRWVLALFVLSVLNMSIQMPLHAAMQQAMQVSQQYNAVNVEPLNEVLQQSHCAMQASQSLAVTPAETTNVSNDDRCSCPPALCDAVEAQQDKLYQQVVSVQLFASLAFYPANFELQPDTVQTRGVVSLRHQDLHYRKITPLPLSLNTVLLI